VIVVARSLLVAVMMMRRNVLADFVARRLKLSMSDCSILLLSPYLIFYDLH
jgi:hypothetical protein